MCGVYGIIGKEAKKLKKNFECMGDQISHRGPDFSGNFISNNLLLGHKRLSILDLSKKSNQPISSFNNRYLISFNGEIYNYLELIKEIGLKKTGDTRVLVQILEKYQINGLPKLRGMFAFAFHDKLKGFTYLVRDRFGIKPLYYLKQSNHLYFSSEIKPLLKISLEVNPEEKVIDDYLRFSLIDHTNKTFFKNIYQLEPGSYLKIDRFGNIIKKFKWYNLRSKLNTKKINNNLNEQFHSIFEETIKLHLRSDVKVGLSLSGGIDSKIILDEIIKNYNYKKLNTYSFYFKGEKYSEKTNIKKNIGEKKFNANLINQNKLLLTEFRKNILIQEQPFGGVATMAMNNIFKKVKDDNIKVMITGSGADDIMGGSNREIIYYLSFIEDKKKFNFELNLFCKNNKLKKNKILKIISKLKKNNLTSADGTSAVNDYFLNNKKINKHKINFKDLKETLINRIVSNKLPRNLRYEDRNSMYNSVENRVPFLDHVLVEFCLNLPDSYLIKDGLGKYILRDTLFKYYNCKFAYKNKQSIQTPQTKWILSKFGKKLISSIIEKRNPFIGNYVNLSKIKDFVKSDKINKLNNSNFIWQWICLEKWYEEFIK